MNKPRWKFWHQSIKEEKDEIKKAQKDGETERYMKAQRWLQMIEAETERRRCREHKPMRRFTP